MIEVIRLNFDRDDSRGQRKTLVVRSAFGRWPRGAVLKADVVVRPPRHRQEPVSSAQDSLPRSAGSFGTDVPSRPLERRSECLRVGNLPSPNRTLKMQSWGFQGLRSVRSGVQSPRWFQVTGSSISARSSSRAGRIPESKAVKGVDRLELASRQRARIPTPGSPDAKGNAAARDGRGISVCRTCEPATTWAQGVSLDQPRRRRPVRPATARRASAPGAGTIVQVP